jgi:hypothetical protein
MYPCVMNYLLHLEEIVIDLPPYKMYCWKNEKACVANGTSALTMEWWKQLD